MKVRFSPTGDRLLPTRCGQFNPPALFVLLSSGARYENTDAELRDREQH